MELDRSACGLLLREHSTGEPEWMVGQDARFDDVILPHLDEAHTLARYLVRDGDARP